MSNFKNNEEYFNFEKNKDSYARLQRRVINLCWASDEMKSRLLKNPKSTLNDVGAEIPEEMKIIVEEVEVERPVRMEGKTLFIYVNPKPEYEDVELTNEELEKVSGGKVAEGNFTKTFSCSWFGGHCDIKTETKD